MIGDWYEKEVAKSRDGWYEEEVAKRRKKAAEEDPQFAQKTQQLPPFPAGFVYTPVDPSSKKTLGLNRKKGNELAPTTGKGVTCVRL